MVTAKKVVLALLAIVFASSALAFGSGIDVARMERAIDLWVSAGQFMGAVLVALPCGSEVPAPPTTTAY